jgi:hypothetical protein
MGGGGGTVALPPGTATLPVAPGATVVAPGTGWVPDPFVGAPLLPGGTVPVLPEEGCTFTVRAGSALGRGSPPPRGASWLSTVPEQADITNGRHVSQTVDRKH